MWFTGFQKEYEFISCHAPLVGGNRFKILDLLLVSAYRYIPIYAVFAFLENALRMENFLQILNEALRSWADIVIVM
jgi:hypothetical protein